MVAECGEWKRKSGVMRNSNALVAFSPLLFSLTSLSPAELDKEISDPITLQSKRERNAQFRSSTRCAE